jgi:hypothetical protein
LAADGGVGAPRHVLHRHTLRAKEADLFFGSTEEWMDAVADRLALAR